MSFFRRPGQPPPRPGGAAPMLQLPSGDPEDEWGWEAEPVQSGVWVVLRFGSYVPENDYRAHGRGSAADVQETTIVKADSGLDAIKAVYKAEFDTLGRSEKDSANGRYVALPFYGQREEALVTADWKADMKLAPQALGPPAAR